MSTFRIAGRVVGRTTQRGVPGLRVEAWDKDQVYDDLIASAVTDEAGTFEMAFGQSRFREHGPEERPDLYFKVYRGRTLIHSTEDSVVWNVAQGERVVDIEVDDAAGGEGALPDHFVVRGQVVEPDGRPVEGITVRAFDKDLRREDVLGEARTDADGRYAIQYGPEERADLVVRVLDGDGEVVAASPLILAAADTQIVDLSVGDGPYRGASEYHRLRDRLEALLGDVDAADLSEEEVIYLAAKAGLDPVRVAYLAKSARLEAKTDGAIPPEAFYSLFHQGLPTSMSALIAQDPAVLQRALEAAIGGNVVAADLQDALEDVQGKFRDQVVEGALGGSEDPSDRASLGDLLNTSGAIAEDEQRIFLRTYLQHDGPIERFWQGLRDDPEFGAETVDALQSTLQLGAVTLNHVPLVKVLQRRREAGELQSTRELAKLDRAGWEALIREEIDGAMVGVPPTVPGADADEKIANYAKTMTRLVEGGFPTAVVATRVADDAELPQAAGIGRFLTANPDFDFAETSIDRYLADHEDALAGIDDAAAVETRLRGMQRLFNITPRYEKYDAMRPLMRDGVDSAHAVQRMGEAAFLRRYATTLGEPLARQVYANASQAHGLALTLFARHGAEVDSVPLNVTAKRPAVVADIPDWESLFGSLDLCSCEHCRSVYSPAAYLVDILHFLADRAAVEEGKTALDVLFERRGDIGQIELNCENTNTVLPYVDLVNEVLENAVVRENGLAADGPYQTEGTPEELHAHPQHLNVDAYTVLAEQAVYPWSLPFDLWAAEARGYLEHLGVPRHEMMDVFRREGEAPAPADVAAEHLGLTPREREIITTQSSGTRLRDLWGMSGSGWAAQLRTASDFLERSSLSYRSFEELLRTRFVNPAGDLRVDFAEPATCDLDQASLQGVSDADFLEVLDRSHRFVRLQRALGWSVHELDFAVQALAPDGLVDDVLVRLSLVEHLRAALNEPLISMLGWWFRLDTAGPDGEPSRYASLFLNKAVTNPLDDAFVLNDTGDELANTGDTIEQHAPAILGALGIGEEELTPLVERELAGDATLNLANLSALYRAVSLARALDLSVHDFLVLRTLSGIDPFGDPAAARRFVAAARRVRDLGFTLDRLDYLLRHRARPSSPAAPGEDEIGLVLRELRDGLRRIAAEHRFAPDPTGERTGQALATVLPEEETRRALALIDGSSTEESAEAEQFIDEHLADFLDPADAKAKLLAPGALTEVPARFEYVLRPLLTYLSRTTSETLVNRRLAETLGLATKSTELLLSELLPSRGDATQRAIADFLALAAPADAGGGITGAPLAAEDFPTQFEGFRRLDKIAGIITGFHIPADELAWVFQNGPGLGWLDLRALPLAEADSGPALFDAWSRMAEAARLDDALPPGAPTVFALLRALDDGAATEADFRTKLVERTGWREEDLAFLIGPGGFHLDFPADYRDEQGLVRLLQLERAFRLIRRLGMSAERIWSWSSPATGAGEAAERAADIKQAVDAKYGEERWLAVAGPLRDALREKQRAALVAYVTHRMADRGVEDAGDLFGHFLIDPEMSSCALTSRIKQATGSVQLFVQRCLMNLEQGVALTPEDAARWDWMKNYRVWEANRKVFLYPENWIEPELRNDKSPFFVDLESELLQNEVTAATTERALRRYLEKLDEVARLEIAGLCDEEDADVLHVFGRTRGAPHVYYYRRRVDEAYWTPWEPVDADIEGDHLIPVVWNRRLHLFWPIFTEGAETEIPGSGQAGEEPQKYWEVQMAWSRFEDGKWSAKKVTEEKVSYSRVSRAPRSDILFDAVESDGDLVISWYAVGEWWWQRRRTGSVPERDHRTSAKYVKTTRFGSFRFFGCDGSVKTDNFVDRLPSTSMPRDTHVSFMKFRENDEDHPLELPSGKRGAPGWANAAAEMTDVDHHPTLTKTPGTFRIACSHHSDRFRTRAPFFYEDDHRTFFVVPRWVVDFPWRHPARIRPEMLDALAEVAGTVLGQGIEDAGGRGLPAGEVRDHEDRVVVPADRDVARLAADPGETIVSGGTGVVVRPGGVVVSDSAGTADTPSTGLPAGEVAGTAGELAEQPVATTTATVGAVLGEGDDRRALPVLGYDKRYRFESFYHPYACLLAGELNRHGVGGLLDPKHDSDASALRRQLAEDGFFHPTYRPTEHVDRPYPRDEIDFSYGGAYSPYNWELFFHTPFMIANRLSQNQRFAEAQAWYHHIFDPTGGPVHGLTAEYFNTIDLTGPAVTRLDPTIDFDWGAGPPVPAVGSDTFSVRWSGKVRPEHTETYTFHTVTDDGVRLRVNGEPIIDTWVNQPITKHSGTIDLEAGKLYDITMEYYEDWGGAIARLLWSSPSTPETVVPHGRLYADVGPPARFWNVKPFFEAAQGRHIQELLLLLGSTDSGSEGQELREGIEKQVEAWRAKPFQPHVVARMRPLAYQKAVVVKYLDNLIAWGDHLFRRDTIESINEATQLYVLAAQILGDRPEEVPGRQGTPTVDGTEVKTFDDLEAHLGEFSNALVELETLLSPVAGTNGTAAEAPTSSVLGPTLFFCIPRNDKLLSYWDTVADRLFKIRHCMNIEGVARRLPLFEPPIEPGLLVRAAAAGVDIGSALNDLGAPLPHYRFQVMLRKAMEFCADVRALGAALLAAIEKRDAEEVALLRSGHEVELLTRMRQVRERQVEEARETLEALGRSREIARHRQSYYASRTYMSAREESYTAKLGEAHTRQEIAQGLQLAVKGLALVPELDLGTSGWAATPVAKARIGGINLSTAAQAASDVSAYLATRSNQQAAMASVMAGYDRRADDWAFQAEQAAGEVERIDREIAAAEIRLAIAERGLAQHDLQVENAEEVDTFMRDKYTGVELYGWMVSQISTTYFQSYQMAYDLAKRAEKAFRHELGVYDDTGFVRFGYWDSLKKGLLCGDKLNYDLKRMEKAYLERNGREYEITQHVSLAMLHPEALVMLRETGTCYVNIPEAAFDLAYPGQYLRRIKSVSLTVPCVTGPYTNVAGTLTLLGSRIRKNADLGPGYAWTGDSGDTRFAYDTGGIQSVATSSGRSDSGVFELDFHDERYLPFEGAGVVGTWRIELPERFRPFDYHTITDVVFHLRYTARDGGAAFRKTVEEELEDSLNDMLLEEGKRGLFRLFALKQEFPNEWYAFLHPPAGQEGQRLPFTLGRQHFPAQFNGRSLRIKRLLPFLTLTDATYENSRPILLSVTSPDGATAEAELQVVEGELGGLPHATVDYGNAAKGLGDWLLQATEENIAELPEGLKVTEETDGAVRHRLNPDAIADLGILCHYELEA